MGEIKFVTGLLFTALFAIAVVAFAVNFADDNDAVVDLGDNTRFDTLTEKVEGNMTLFHGDVEDSSSAFFESEITTGDETTRTGGQFKVGIVSLVGTLSSILVIIKEEIFGGSTSFGIFITAITSLFGYIGVRYIWKTWKGGNPD